MSNVIQPCPTSAERDRPPGRAMVEATTPARGRLLVVDSDPLRRQHLRRSLSERGHSLRTCATEAGALAELKSEEPEVLLIDVHDEHAPGLQLCASVRERTERTRVIVMAGQTDTRAAIAAIRAGAFDVITKPIDPKEIEAVVQRALSARRSNAGAHELAREVAESDHDLIGASAAIRTLREIIDQLRGTDANVMIMGERGTGKKLVARALHRSSPRADGPLEIMGCAAGSAYALERELFGSFDDTGGAGLLARACGGALVLDELGALPPCTQRRLMRLLATPRGEDRKPEVRLLATAHSDLGRLVARGVFEAELYERLRVIKLHIPPLRVRERDALLLAQHFIDVNRRRTRKDVRGISTGAAELLLRYRWPGNVSELEQVIQSSFTLTREHQIAAEDLPERVRASAPSERETLDTPTNFADFERLHIARALAAADGNKTRAAELLGISRRSLYRKLDRLEIDNPTSAKLTKAPAN